MSVYTTTEKRKCAERELAMRKNAYPRFIQRGKMSKEQAEREIAIMAEIVEDYAAGLGGIMDIDSNVAD